MASGDRILRGRKQRRTCFRARSETTTPLGRSATNLKRPLSSRPSEFKSARQEYSRQACHSQRQRDNQRSAPVKGQA